MGLIVLVIIVIASIGGYILVIKISIFKKRPFAAYSAIHMISAGLVLINELWAISNRIPGGNFPIEHKFSWARVLLFCGIGIISSLVAWIFTREEHFSVLVPPLNLVLLIAAFATLLSLLSNYPSVSGWCCEVYPTHYFGFPFSYLNGNSPFPDIQVSDLAKVMKNLFRYFPYQLFLNLLFWANTSFIVLCLSSLFIQKGNVAQQSK